MKLPEFDDELNDLFKNDIVAFAKIVLKFFPLPYQEKALREITKEPMTAFVWSRQIGKTRTIAVETAHYMIFNDKVNVLVVSPTQSQSDLFINYVREYFEENELLKDYLRQNIQTRMQIKNKSTIVSLPSGQGVREGYQIRGYHANRIIIDEAAQMSSSLINTVVLPLGSFTNASIRMMSTPFGKNWFHRVTEKDVNRVISPREWFSKLNYKVYHMDIQEASKYSNEIKTYLNEKVLPMMSKSSTSYRREYMAQFLEEETQVFPVDLVNKFFDRQRSFQEAGEQDHYYVIGVDLAKWRDATAIVVVDVLEDDTRKIVLIDDHFNTPAVSYVEIKNSILDVCSRFDVNKIVLDTSSPGHDSVLDEVQNALGDASTNVEGFYFERVRRIGMIDYLIRLMEQGNIESPYHDKLNKEMLDYQKTKTPKGLVRYDHPPDGSSDRLDALLLAIHGSQEINYEPIVKPLQQGTKPGYKPKRGDPDRYFRFGKGSVVR